MKLVPLGDRVVLKQLVAEETTKSGIVLPGQNKEKPQQAEVVAVGPGGMVVGKEVKMEVKVGDKVIYSKYSGTDVKLDDVEYIVVKQSDIVAVIEREPGTYPNARDVADIIDLVRSKEVKAIFIEPQYSRSAADTIARETGISVYVLDPIVTGELNKDAYIDMMNQNLKVLEEALN